MLFQNKFQKFVSTFRCVFYFSTQGDTYYVTRLTGGQLSVKIPVLISSMVRALARYARGPGFETRLRLCFSQSVKFESNVQIPWSLLGNMFYNISFTRKGLMVNSRTKFYQEARRCYVYQKPENVAKQLLESKYLVKNKTLK